MSVYVCMEQQYSMITKKIVPRSRLLVYLTSYLPSYTSAATPFSETLASLDTLSPISFSQGTHHTAGDHTCPFSLPPLIPLLQRQPGHGPLLLLQAALSGGHDWLD